MDKLTVKIASRYKQTWLFVKPENKKTFRMPGGKVALGENIIKVVKSILYEELGVVSACLYRVNEVLFIADIKCIGAIPENNIIDVVEIHENNVYDQSIHSPMKIMNSVEKSTFIKLHDWMMRRKNLTKESCVQFEKVCGAVTYKEIDDIRYFLLIRNESGHIGFPKGHVEDGENEEETAMREVFEETGLNIPLKDGFRHSFEYIIPGNKRIKRISKLAVYFIAEFHEEKVQIQASEISKWWLVPFKEALSILNKETDRELLRLANAWLDKTKKVTK